MGMYTELVLNVGLSDTVPKDVIVILRYMLSREGEKPTGGHDLFSPGRWEWMLRSGSFYFVPEAQSKLIENFPEQESPTYHLSIRCDLKNYSNEIESFLSWIAPYVEDFGDLVFGGYTRYEEAENPTLIYFPNGEVEYRVV